METTQQRHDTVRGEEWLALIAEERYAALAEHKELLAQAAAAKERAHQHDAVEAWLQQMMSSSTPQLLEPVPANAWEALHAVRARRAAAGGAV